MPPFYPSTKKQREAQHHYWHHWWECKCQDIIKKVDGIILKEKEE